MPPVNLDKNSLRRIVHPPAQCEAGCQPVDERAKANALYGAMEHNPQPHVTRFIRNRAVREQLS